jgi:ABC-type dipeptide/oligopeptide/nickel transport system permease component
MLKYVLRRFCSAVFSLFIIVTVMFCLLRMMPLEGYLGPNVDKMSPEVVAAKLAAKGLDKPVHIQLAGNQLVQEFFRMLIFKYFNGKVQFSFEGFVEFIHEHG